MYIIIIKNESVPVSYQEDGYDKLNNFIFRKKGCGYSSWWITIKAKFFRLSHDVVTCDVDRDVSIAYC